MARKIELKTITLSPETTLSNGEDHSVSFSYAQMLKALLRFGPPGGLNFDDVVRCVEAMRSLEDAIKVNADHVVFPEEQWRTVRDKLNIFTFAIADPVIVDFGSEIRNAPEIGT